MPAIESFDEDTHARRNGYGEKAEPSQSLRAVEPTRCIEHGALPCAACDGEWGELPQVELKRAA